MFQLIQSFCCSSSSSVVSILRLWCLHCLHPYVAVHRRGGGLGVVRVNWQEADVLGADEIGDKFDLLSPLRACWGRGAGWASVGACGEGG